MLSANSAIFCNGRSAMDILVAPGAWSILNCDWSKGGSISGGSFHTIMRAVEPESCQDVMNKSRCSLRISPFRGRLQRPFEGSPQGTSPRNSEEALVTVHETIQLVGNDSTWLISNDPGFPCEKKKHIGPGTGRNLNVHPWIRCKRRCGFLHFEILTEWSNQ